VKKSFFVYLFISTLNSIALLLIYIDQNLYKYTEITAIVFFAFIMILSIKRFGGCFSPLVLFLVCFGIFLLSRNILDLFGVCHISDNDFFQYVPFKPSTICQIFLVYCITFHAFYWAIELGGKQLSGSLGESEERIVTGLIFFIFFLSATANIYQILLKARFYQKYGYLGFYLNYSDFLSMRPLFVRVFDSMFYLCTFFLLLSNRVDKRVKRLIFFFAVFCELIELISGDRGRVFSYFLVTMLLYNNKIGKIRVILIAIIGFTIIISSQFVVSYRFNEKISFKPLDVFTSFLYQQGVSQNVLGMVVENKGYLNNVSDCGLEYLFAPVIDEMNQHLKYLPQSEERAYESYHLSQKLSFFMDSNRYLNGFGLGSSYLAELLLSGGFFGVFFGNVILVILLNRLFVLTSRSIFLGTMLFTFLPGLLLAPRASFIVFPFQDIIFILVIWVINGYLKMGTRKRI
jgi:oligosaccharide repeat unit polymerase